MSISSRHNGVKRLLAFCTCAVLLSSCGSGSESALTLPQKSTFPGKEWEKGAIPQFVDQESLRQRIDPELQLYEEAPAVQSAVVVYRGRIIYETYSPLYTKDTVALSYSIAKSVLFAAIGIAIDQGLMRVTDTHLSPVWSDTDPRSKISVENMLHMESGLEWGEDWDTGDPLQLVKYSSGAAAFAAFVLSGIKVETNVGQSLHGEPGLRQSRLLELLRDGPACVESGNAGRQKHDPFAIIGCLLPGGRSFEKDGLVVSIHRIAAGC